MRALNGARFVSVVKFSVSHEILEQRNARCVFEDVSKRTFPQMFLHPSKSESCIVGVNMSAERADATEVQQPQEPLSAGSSLPFRIAKQPERHRIQRLIDLTHSLLREAEMLVGEKVFVDESRRLQELNISEGIDFFGELQQFEISLIKLALAQTSGHQARAAKLLNIKPTTLNTKIKQYKIEY